MLIRPWRAGDVLKLGNWNINRKKAKRVLLAWLTTHEPCALLLHELIANTDCISYCVLASHWKIYPTLHIQSGSLDVCVCV